MYVNENASNINYTFDPLKSSVTNFKCAEGLNKAIMVNKTICQMLFSFEICLHNLSIIITSGGVFLICKNL